MSDKLSFIENDISRDVGSLSGRIEANVAFSMGWVTQKDAGSSSRLKFVVIIWSEVGKAQATESSEMG